MQNEKWLKHETNWKKHGELLGRSLQLEILKAMTSKICPTILLSLVTNAKAELWNDHCSKAREPWKRLHVGCAILAVNGLSGNTKQMQQELETAPEAREP